MTVVGPFAEPCSGELWAAQSDGTVLSLYPHHHPLVAGMSTPEPTGSTMFEGREGQSKRVLIRGSTDRNANFWAFFSVEHAHHQVVDVRV